MSVLLLMSKVVVPRQQHRQAVLEIRYSSGLEQHGIRSLGERRYKVALRQTRHHEGSVWLQSLVVPYLGPGEPGTAVRTVRFDHIRPEYHLLHQALIMGVGLARYTSFSVLAAAAVIYHAFATREQARVHSHTHSSLGLRIPVLLLSSQPHSSTRLAFSSAPRRSQWL